ncbi:MAG: DUF6789 family protein [Pirellulales bacterium]
MHNLTRGGFAGFAATAPMTIVMAAVERVLMPSQEPLPPEQITENLAKRAELEGVGERKKKVASWLAHFGYGATTGAIYGLVAERVRAPAALKGAAYGLGIWAASYLGWLPAAGILPPATRQSRRRNVSLVAAHVIWGATTGLAVDRLSHR